MPPVLKIHHIDFNFVNIRPEYLRIWLRQLADMGYNAVLWEVEDKVQWETCPDAVWPEALTKSDFRSILDEAENLGLEAIPLLQTIGHAEYILKQDAYRHMRELPDRHDCYCTENPAVRTFLKRLITEHLELFGKIRHFHLGGDEAYVFARCPTCLPEARKIGRNTLYARHMLDISAPIRSRGIRAGIWCDMILSHPEQLDAIPSELEIWDWNYWDGDGPLEEVQVWGKGRVKRNEVNDDLKRLYPEILAVDGQLQGFYTSDALVRMGYEVILCSAARAFGDSVFCPRTALRAGNIVGAARKTATARLLGTCVTDWAIRLNSWRTHRSLLPLAPQILNDPSVELTAALEKAAGELFGPPAAGLIAALNLTTEVDLPFGQARSTGIQWNGLKDSVPPPPHFIRDLLGEWAASGRLEKERIAVDATIAQIETGLEKLRRVAAEARTATNLLSFWQRAGDLQLNQARLARELLAGERGRKKVHALKELKRKFEEALSLDQTPRSAAKNAALVYDCLIEYVQAD